MAEGGKEQTSGWGGGTWLSGWINAAKEQTEKVFEVVSNDLVEFTNTMQQDTKNAVEKTKETLQQGDDKANKSTTDMMKQSFHSLMTGITKALTVEPDEDVPVKKKSPHETSELFDRAKARLRAVQVDAGTYLNEPSGPGEKYAEWLKSFDLDKHKGEISDLLVTMVEVRSLYTSLVPSEVSHQDFWRRYFYKLHQLKMDEERKQALMKRADIAHVKEDTVNWDEEEWSGDESPDHSPQKQKESTKSVDERSKQAEIESRLKPDVENSEGPTLANEDKDKSVVGAHNKSVSPDYAEEKQKDLNPSKEMKEDVKKRIPDEKNIPVINEEKQSLALSTGSDSLTDSITNKDSVTDSGPSETIVTQGQTKEIKVTEGEKAVKTDCDKTSTKSDRAKPDETSKSLDQSSKSVDKAENVDTTDRDLKTKVKGDMIVVGDRESPSSESSGNKESSAEDWEQDFDVEITPEDLAAASELAQKMNMSASDYSKITGETEKVFEVVSNDLVEFTNTMQQDTKNAVEKTKETLQQGDDKANKSTTDMMKQSFHSLMTGITKALTVEPDEDVPVKKKSPHETSELFDRAKARLRAVQVDTGTYLNEPSGTGEKYAEWLKSFDLDKHKGEISDLLVTMVEVRSLYTSLVPSEVSHQDFWRRYFYKLHQLKMDEERKQALMKRAEIAHVKEDTVNWDEEEWSGDESPDHSPQKQKESTKSVDERSKQAEIESRLKPHVENSEGPTLANEDKDKSVVGTHNKSVSPDYAEEKQNDLNPSKEMKEGVKKTIPDEKNIPVINEEKQSQGLSTGSDSLTDSITNKDSVTDSGPSETIVTQGQTKENKVTEGEKAVKIDCDKTSTKSDKAKPDETSKSVDQSSKSVDKAENVDTTDRDLKTKVKGDMIVVGDRESPSSESSGNKESSAEDWEQDFDVEITPEDLAAASELAQKMNMSASDYSKITGEDDDWENWD